MDVVLLTLVLVGGAVLAGRPLRRELRHLTPHGRAAAHREAMGVLAGASRGEGAAARAPARRAPSARGPSSARREPASRRAPAADPRRRAARERAALRRRRVRIVLAAGVLTAPAALPSVGLVALPLLLLLSSLLAAHVWLGARLAGAGPRAHGGRPPEAARTGPRRVGEVAR